VKERKIQVSLYIFCQQVSVTEYQTR